MTCTACNGTLRPTPLGSQLSKCESCGGLHGTLYLGEAVGMVGLGKPMVSGEYSDSKYFDLTVLGSEGVERVHGWYSPSLGRVVQYG